MIKLGVDFDNTLINYDALFKKVAFEKKLVPHDFPKSKSLIRNYLIEHDQGNTFTMLQGEIYGPRIFEASQSEGMFEALRELRNNDVEIFIISHKTKNPYKGISYDLHNSALDWLHKNLFFEKSGVNISRENVYFEDTKEKKVQRIEAIGCSHFIDDLPEILNMISFRIKKILYNPFDNKLTQDNFISMLHWSDLRKLLN